MCIGISGVWARRLNKLYTVSGVNSHSDIRKYHHISDNKRDEQLNLEAWPTEILTNASDWEMHVDHSWHNIEWDDKEKEKAEKALMKFVSKEIYKINQTSKYNGYLDLRGTQIKSLGSLKSVGGDLGLRDTNIKINDKIRHIVTGNIYSD